MTFTIDGVEHTFRGTVSLFPADNLASQYIGGYKALNAALRKCRQCLAVQEDMQSKVRVTHNCCPLASLFYKLFKLFCFSYHSSILHLQFLSEDFQPRTRETHANHCSSLEGPLHNHYATAYGLHRDSSLNTLKFFHVTEGLIPDIMHDCLEGCVQYEVKELLKYLSSMDVLNVSTINELIQSFPYLGPDSRNRPSPITTKTLASPDHNLKQTGEVLL